MLVPNREALMTGMRSVLHRILGMNPPTVEITSPTAKRDTTKRNTFALIRRVIDLSQEARPMTDTTTSVALT
jgi:hypothetical protein